MTTRRSFVLLAACFALAAPFAVNAETAKDNPCYEFRVYYAAPGKLDALHARFRDHTLQLFEKHGMTNIGYWVPLENAEQKLIYVLAHKSREAQEQSWKSFAADPDWKKAKEASEQGGRLVAKIERHLMQATDYSPKIEPSSAGPRIFELRTYKTTPGNLDALNKRFREHTKELFAKHGMTNLFYWNLLPGQKGAEDTLIYILAHKDADAQAASFKGFRADPDWVAARTASEKAAGGSLTAAENGVVSVLMKATDYSPTK